MPDAATLSTILAVHWLVTMTPGPNAVLVAQTAVARGRLNALAVIAGICASGAIWVTSAALGLKAVFVAAPWLHAFVSYLGAAYLVWLGLKLLVSTSKPPPNLPPDRAAERPGLSFAKGFASNITNPKTLVYFTSVFGTFMPPDAGPETVVAVILVTWLCNFGWYGGLSLLLSGETARRLYGRAGTTINRVAGVAMILFGLRIVVARPQ